MKKAFLNKNICNFIVSLFFTLIEACFSIYIAFVLKNLTDIATSQDLSNIKTLILELILFIIGFILIGVLKSRFQNRYIGKAMCNFRNQCFKRLFESKYNIAYGQSTGKFISYFTNNMDSIQKNYVEGFLDIVSNTLLMLLGIFTMLYLNPLMAVVVILISFLPIIGAMLMSNKVASAEAIVSEKSKSYVEEVRDVFSGYTVIKSFGAEPETINLLNKETKILETSKLIKRNNKDLVDVISGTLSNISIVATFIVGVYMTITGKISVGTVIAFIQLLNYVLSPIEKISSGITDYKSGLELVSIFDEELKSKPEITEKIKMDDISDITLQNVNLAYENNKVLKDVNLNFEKGKSYAIVGNSGSGKTTLLNLISGMIDEYSGNILINGTEVTKINSESKNRLFSIIQQNVIIFNSTIKNNITMWKNGFSDEEIVKAVKKAKLDNLIEQKSFDYICGENGKNLSGGEKQRISIARAILQGASVILVDEGTSALDKESATDIENSLVMFKDKIAISVTHRLDAKSLSRYDNIIAIKNGNVMECGNFEELIENKGYFWALYNA